MNCYDCHQNNTTTPAVGICHECGVAICAQHGTKTTQQFATTLSMGLIARPTLGILRCHPCNEAITAAHQRRSRAS